LSAKTPFDRMKAPKVISPYGIGNADGSENSDANSPATMVFSPERKNAGWPVVGASSGSVNK